MAAPTDVLSRIDEIEGELRGLSAELHELRALVSQAAVAPAAAPATARRRSTSSGARPPRRSARRPGSAPRGRNRRRAHPSLRGRAERSAGRARACDRVLPYRPRRPCAGSNPSSRESRAISRPCERGQRSSPRRRASPRSRPGGTTAPGAAPCRRRSPPRPARARRPSSRLVPATPAIQAKPVRPAARLAQLAADWDLLGPRGFAIIGGAVTAFGIILLFVLAANRGWITPAMRVAFGACVSAAAVGVAFWVRSRYGQLQMSLGAAGAGIAGGYATLAAAAARYDLVPDWLALPLAGGLAAVAVVIAIAWSSETVAAIGLLGAALAPALQAIDTGLSWPSVAFAVIILGATVMLAVPRRWHELLIGIAVASEHRLRFSLSMPMRRRAQARPPSSPRSCWSCSQQGSGCSSSPARRISIRSRARSCSLRSASRSCSCGRLDVDSNQGYALAGAAVVWAGAWLALRRRPACPRARARCLVALPRRRRDRRPAVGTSLAITWAAEALLLSFVALRVRDARLQATALVYCAVTAAHVLLVDAPPRLDIRGARSRDRRGVGRCAGARAARRRHPRARRGGGAHGDRAPRLARSRSRLARGASGRAAGGPRSRRRRGRHVRGRDPAHRVLVPHRVTSPPRSSPRPWCRCRGDLVATRLRRARRGVADLVGGVFAIATASMCPSSPSRVHRSYGGWALIAASAGVLAACFAFQLLFRGVRHTGVPAGGGVLALAGAAAGIALISRRRRARVDLDRLAAARADACLPRPLGERVPHSPPSRSRDHDVGARCSRAPRQRVARRPRRDVARGCLRGHRGRPRPALPAPARAAALARRLDRRVRDGIRHHRRPRRGLGASTAPSRCATRSPGSRPRPPSWSSARSRGETRRGAISSPSPGRPRSSR